MFHRPHAIHRFFSLGEAMTSRQLCPATGSRLLPCQAPFFRLMTPVAHEYPMTILEHHLDTFGHVNNAMYLQLFETARWQWITDGGDGFD